MTIRPLLLALLAFGCGQEVPAPLPANDALVTVNGAAITTYDVQASSPSAHGTPPSEDVVLDRLVLEELVTQRAVELGLDADPAYQQMVRELQARTHAVQREQLGRLFDAHLVAQTTVTEDDARRYFDDHAAELQTEVHVWQMLYRERAPLEEAQVALDRGEAFEAVAAKRFEGMPPQDRDPWDLGYLRWNQIPDAWREVVYDLQPGQVSGIIEGPNKRFWLIRLVDRRVNSEISYEVVAPVLLERLQVDEVARAREEALRELREQAEIVYPP